MDDSVKESWVNFLNPAVLRSNMIVASIYITAFEMLKNSIIGKLENFYATGFENGSWIIDDRYKEKVLSKGKNPLQASLQWLRQMSAIDEDDIKHFEEIKRVRNKLAHEMPELLGSLISLDIVEPLQDLISLLEKIDLWWIREVDIPTNPDFDGQDIDCNQITPGSIITLRLMLDIALGSKEESEYYFKEFKRRT